MFKPKTEITADGRVCCKCWKFKLRKDYSVCRSVKAWYTSKCKDCRNAYHKELRERHDYEWDRRYKLQRRKLEIWDQIYFHNEIWEVKEYRNKKWYTVKSIMNWTERIISTSDNHNYPNNHCVRFVKLKNPIVMVRTTEKPKFSVETDDEFYELI